MMLIWIFNIILIISLLFLLYKKKYGYLLSFLFIYTVYLTHIIKVFGVEGYVLLTRYSLIIILLFVTYKYWRYNWKYLKNSAIVFALLLLTFSLIIFNAISINSQNPMVLLFQRDYFIYLFIPFIIITLLSFDKTIFVEIIASVPFWGIYYILYFIINYKFYNFYISRSVSFNEVTGNDPIAASRLFGLSVIVLYILLLSGKKKKLLILLLLIINIIIVLFVGQRGTIIGIAIGLSIYTMYIKENNKSLIYVAITAIIISQLIDIRNFRIFEKMQNLKSFRTMPRYLDYKVSWKIFEKNSFLWGEGSMGYWFNTGRLYPHNIVLECMVEYGLPGLISIMIIIFVGLYYGHKVLSNRNVSYHYKIVPIIWIMLLTSALVSSSLVSNSLFIIFSGILLVVYKMTEKNIVIL